ncbi:MAG: tetratricopeptide repeat protein, partial [Synergistaceae bacterium]|nr:tetratricopeptide repeat protein [Synergistaceae bacterium]
AEEEKKFREAQALQLRKDAEQLMKQKNRRDDAIQLYRESLNFAYNKAADDLVKEADTKAARARADELIREAEALVKQNKPEEALEKYKLAFTKVPNDQKLAGEIKKLENVLLKAVAEPTAAALSVDTKPEENVVDHDDSEQLKAADNLFKEANALYTQKKYNEALSKYKESYELSKNEKLKEFIDRFEKTVVDVEKANSFVRKANELYRQGNFTEALENYRESLKVYKNPQVEEFIVKVEALIEK